MKCPLLALLAAILALPLACSGGAPGTPSGSRATASPSYTDVVDPASNDGRTLALYYGPMKLMYGESILHSITAVTGHGFGAFDFTSPDPGSQAFVDAGNGDGDFYRHCRLLGGCLEHRIPQPRTSFVGTAYVLELERAVVEACNDLDTFGMFPGEQAPDEGTQVGEVVEHQYRRAFGAPPSTADTERSIAYFESHMVDPEGDDVLPIESAGRGHCRALLTTNRFLFY